MSIGTKVSALLAIVALTGSCGADVTSPEALTITGEWGQGAYLLEEAKGQTHIHTGRFAFVRRGGGFAGEGRQSGFCRTVGGDYTGPLATGVSYQIARGVQDGDRVSFRSDLCAYEGTISADGKEMSGTARCAYTDGGVKFVWTGNWLANRQR
jgi:hypothetical protein